MCKVASTPCGNVTVCFQSVSQLLAALVTGAFNSLAFFLFLAPPAALWLAWKNPYIVVPPAVAYFFLSYDGSELKEGRPWPAFTQRMWIFRLARGYHDLQLHLDPALEPSEMTGDEKFVFGLHPHGVLSDYRILLDGATREYFPKLRSWRALAASVLFKFPVWREISLWSHCIDAGRATAQYALDRGHSLFIVPGGEHEQILGEYGKEVLYLKKRMGFIKLALRNGVPVVPVYVFGANDVFRTSSFLQKARLGLVKSLRVALPLFWGRFGLPIPREVPLRIVFGAPLTFGNDTVSNVETNNSNINIDNNNNTEKKSAKKNTKTTTTKEERQSNGKGDGELREVGDEELREAHGAYVDALRKLFDDNKARFGYADRKLYIL